MKSIYEQALGNKFKQLHPELQKKFGLTSDQGIAYVSKGVMEEIWGGSFLIRPFLWIGQLKHLTFSERGKDISFTLENYAYKDKRGRECIAWIRMFEFKKTRRFDATMVYSKKRKGIVDYLGIDQDLFTDIHFSLLENGGLKLSSHSLTMCMFGVPVQVPSLFSALTEVEEWYDDMKNCFHIKVEVTNKLFGTIFGYKGTFSLDFLQVDESELPAYVMPRREVYID